MSEVLTLPVISREELKPKMDSGERFTLVETLPAMAYYGGHLPGAINLAPDQVSKVAPKVLPDKSAEIVVYCGSPT